MATQGVLSVLDGGRVVVKLVTGSDGYMIPDLANAIREAQPNDVTPEMVFEAAKDLGVGSCGSLFVMDAVQHWTNSAWDLPDVYRRTFEDPEWNPRWELGTADFVEVVHLEPKAGA